MSLLLACYSYFFITSSKLNKFFGQKIKVIVQKTIITAFLYRFARSKIGMQLLWGDHINRPISCSVVKKLLWVPEVRSSNPGSV